MIPTQRIHNAAFWLGLILPVFALLATVWVTRLTNGQFNAAFASVTHTYNVLNILEETQAHIADAETGQRGFLLTSRPDYFSLYDTAMAAINNNIQKLKILVRGNLVQETNLVQLQSLIITQLGPNPDTVAFSKTNSPDAVAVVLTDRGREAINQIRDVLFRMRIQQTDLLITRQQTAEARFLFDQTISLVMVGVTAIALIAIVAILLRLEHMRKIVTICAWTGQVKFDGEWIRMEDYLKRRFGVSVSHGLSREASSKLIQEIRQTKQPPDSPGPAAG
ncbi:MAG: CHASE3 domain-containing protein [Verrucomicrobiota bacterium]|jgi:CHASE3 domain sensor protein